MDPVEAAEGVIAAWRALDPDSQVLLGTQLRTLNLAFRLQLLADALVSAPVDTEIEEIGALRVEIRGPWAHAEKPGLARVRGVTDGGPWAQHNFPCPVCKERPARVDIAGWVFGPCSECRIAGWELGWAKPRPRKRWSERLTRHLSGGRWPLGRRSQPS